MEREIFGYTFTDEVPEDIKHPSWVNTYGQNRVVVVPPNEECEDWRVIVPQMDAAYRINGEEAEDRAFAAAVGYIEQARR